MLAAAASHTEVEHGTTEMAGLVCERQRAGLDFD